MPKLPALRSRHLVAFLRVHGFQLDHVTGSHFVFRHPESRRRAVVPRHPRDIPAGTILAIIREAGFSRDDLLRFLHGQ